MGAVEMASRIKAGPVLHGEPRRERSSTWLEILFDLILCGAIVALGDALDDHATARAFGMFALAACAAWQAWTGFTFFHNRFRADDLIHRGLVLFQLCAIALLGAAAPDVMRGNGATFSWAYAAVALVSCALYARARHSAPEASDLSRHYAATYGLEAAIWGAAAALPTTFTRPLWSIGCLVGFSFPLNPKSRELAEKRPPNVAHVTHRYGMLVLVLLGEAFASAVGQASAPTRVTSALVVALTLLVAFCLFWLYFDDVAGSEVKGGQAARLVWVYSHFPLAVGIATLGAGLRDVLRTEGALPPSARWLVAGGLGLSLVSLGLIDSVTDRPQAELGDRVRVNARLASALLALVIAPVSARMPALQFLSLTAVLGVAQVAFDLMLAPAIESVSEEAEPTASIATRRMAGQGVPAPSLAGGARALRIGTPAELRADFYSFFMDGPWSRLVISLVLAYLAVNAFFGGLYLLEPGALANARPGTFSDAFFFSVQTFSTIGYGVMTPRTPYGNLVVTAEAAVGLLSAAFATGLMFAKAARPRSSALFSRPMILTLRNGVPTLIFRVGNARGNDVVDATIFVTALKEEVTAEGHHMRRQHDLKLVRDRSPFFTLTWVVMHEITEESPLHGVDWANPRDLVSIVTTLSGHDGTYGQTTYARHVYGPGDVRVGHRFVDVLSQLTDGRMMVDYAKFHDTVPDDAYSRAEPTRTSETG